LYGLTGEKQTAPSPVKLLLFDGHALREAGLVDPAGDDGLPHFGNRLRDVDAARASLDAIKGRAAAPHAHLVAENMVVVKFDW
jgi:hypothetical protein